MKIQLNNITVMERIRQDNGDLQPPDGWYP